MPLSKAAMTAGLESGIDTFAFRGDAQSRARASEWAALGRARQLFVREESGVVEDDQGKQVGQWFTVAEPSDVKRLEERAADATLHGDVFLEATGWKVIPAENLVALLQAQSSGRGQSKGPACRLIGCAKSAADAALMLGALEVGTHGAVLMTGDAAEVRQFGELRSRLHASGSHSLNLQPVRVTRVEPVGAGDRVCVDLACLMRPGEGLLVGSLAHGLFLVHSECEETSYINARPFRVNAGPVHAYVHGPGGRTSYLSELRSGSEAVVVDAAGRQRSAVVGRVKVESRPLVLVEAVSRGGQALSLLLQNAETVKLVGPSVADAPSPSGSVAWGQQQWLGGPRPGDGAAAAASSSAFPSATGQQQLQQGGSTANKDAETQQGARGGSLPSSSRGDGVEATAPGHAGDLRAPSSPEPEPLSGIASSSEEAFPEDTPASPTGSPTTGGGGSGGSQNAVEGWRTLSVSQLAVGDEVYALVQEQAGMARHTGIAIREFIVER